MKKVFTFIAAIVVCVSASAATATKTFIGQGSFGVPSMSVTVDMAKSPVKVADDYKSITLPSMSYQMNGNVMTIPSITFSDLTYTTEGLESVGNLDIIWQKSDYSFDIDVEGVSKTVKVSSLNAEYITSAGKLNITVSFTYGNMPLALKYTNTAYYTVDNKWNLVGCGTAAIPYRLYAADDFASIASVCDANNTGEGEYFVMNNNIDFGGSADNAVQMPCIAKAAITNITNIAYGFDGTFDGSMYTISGIYNTNNSNDANGKFNALFSSVGTKGTVKNIVMGENNSLKTYWYSAPIVAINQGTIDNCINNTPVEATAMANAGICAYMANGNGTISNCVNNASIYGTTYSAGIVAMMQSGAKITQYNYLVVDCENYGYISTANGTGSAGIVGSQSGTVKDCINGGKIDDSKGTSKTISNTGGIVAVANYAVTIDGNKNNGEVLGANKCAGIVGYIMKGGDADVTISNNENNGNVTANAGSTNVAGIYGGSALVSGKVADTNNVNNGTVTILDATAIANVAADATANTDAAYNIAGQRVNASAKGLVIRGGKKYFVK